MYFFQLGDIWNCASKILSFPMVPFHTFWKYYKTQVLFISEGLFLSREMKVFKADSTFLTILLRAKNLIKNL